MKKPHSKCSKYSNLEYFVFIGVIELYEAVSSESSTSSVGALINEYFPYPTEVINPSPANRLKRKLTVLESFPNALLTSAVVAVPPSDLKVSSTAFLSGDSSCSWGSASERTNLKGSVLSSIGIFLYSTSFPATSRIPVF